MEDYASIGIPEAWLVSPEAQSVEVRKLDQGRLAIAGILVDGDLRPSRFPGLTIRISEIWPDPQP